MKYIIYCVRKFFCGLGFHQIPVKDRGRNVFMVCPICERLVRGIK